MLELFVQNWLKSVKILFLTCKIQEKKNYPDIRRKYPNEALDVNHEKFSIFCSQSHETLTVIAVRVAKKRK
jgi:hypothetical protein